MNILIANIAIFISLIPWVSFRFLNLDTQPWFIIAVTLFVVLNFKKTASIYIWFSLFLPISAIFIAIIYREFDFLTARAVSSYYAFFIVLLSFYYYRRYVGSALNIIIFSNVLWLVAGLIQVVFGSLALSALVIVRTTEDRGVTGLAPEPTFYGMFLFFISWLLILESELLNKNRRKVYVLLISNFIFILLVAKSAMVVLFIFIALLCYSAVYLFSFKRIVVFCISMTFLGALVYFNTGVFEGSRLYKLVNVLLESPGVIIQKDGSINERASHLYFSIKAFVVGYGFPHGFHSFSEYLVHERDLSNGFFWWGKPENKVMSGVGSIAYELGWGVCFFLVSFFGLLWNKYELKRSIFTVTLLFGLMLSAIPLAFPIIPMIMVSTFFYNQKTNREKNENIRIN
ncbi:MAG: hypothetical protein WBA64_11710 [Marinomonas sp.]|uniref:hypothetical protein n=1 Tax=Marinomonas sp. TaxID=1904862 RepID=UPI003C761602